MNGARKIVGSAVAVLVATTMVPERSLAAGAPAVNTSIYTTYNFNTGDTEISWVTCGATSESEGCFQSGQLTGFGKVCAVLTSQPHTIKETTKQFIYIFDSAFKGGTSVYLDIYKKIDVTTESYDTTTFTPVSQVELPIQSGASAKCFAAADSGYIFAGTSLSDNAVRISKKDYTLASIGGFSPPIPVTAIAVDSVGNISVNFGSGPENGFVLYAPNGEPSEDGGGNAYLFNEKSAFSPP
jgi:hypothetical protein